MLTNFDELIISHYSPISAKGGKRRRRTYRRSNRKLSSRKLSSRKLSSRKLRRSYH